MIANSAHVRRVEVGDHLGHPRVAAPGIVSFHRVGEGADAVGLIREAGDQFGRRVGEAPAGVVLEVPVARDDMAEEPVELGRVGDQPSVKVAGVPVVQDMADVEDDGPRAARQPWRALNRRFVLLMT